MWTRLHARTGSNLPIPGRLSCRASSLAFDVHCGVRGLDEVQIPRHPDHASALDSAGRAMVRAEQQPSLVLEIAQVEFPLIGGFPHLDSQSRKALHRGRAFRACLHADGRCGRFKPVEIVLKAFSVDRPKDLKKVYDYEKVCDLFLFDTKCEQYGGSGNQFDWSILHTYNGDVPFLLSGGINSYSANALKEFKHPRLAGYDLNSRFETKPGEKDPERIRTFLNELKSSL